MTSLHQQIRQVLQALEFVNIDRIDELQALLEQRTAQKIRPPVQAFPKVGPATESAAEPGGFLDFLLPDFLQSKGATLHVTGRSG